MVEFTCDNQPIQASRRRVVAIAFGDVDRISLNFNTQFTGSAILVTVFSLSAKFQYHLVFQSLASKPVEIWHSIPEEVSLTDSGRFETELGNTLKEKGIILSNVQQDSANFTVLLTRLPMAFNDENETAPAGGFTTPDKSTAGKKPLAPEDRKTLGALFTQF